MFATAALWRVVELLGKLSFCCCDLIVVVCPYSSLPSMLSAPCSLLCFMQTHCANCKESHHSLYLKSREAHYRQQGEWRDKGRANELLELAALEAHVRSGKTNNCHVLVFAMREGLKKNGVKMYGELQYHDQQLYNGMHRDI